MKDAKVHIAGKPKGFVQRCVRCHAQLNGGMNTSYWIQGHAIWSDGRGMRDIDELPNHKPARDCGRTGR